MVTHPSTNQAQRTITSPICPTTLLLCDATKRRLYGSLCLLPRPKSHTLVRDQINMPNVLNHVSDWSSDLTGKCRKDRLKQLFLRGKGTSSEKPQSGVLQWSQRCRIWLSCEDVLSSWHVGHHPSPQNCPSAAPLNKRSDKYIRHRWNHRRSKTRPSQCMHEKENMLPKVTNCV